MDLCIYAWQHIFGFCHPVDRQLCRLVCKQWNEVMGLFNDKPNSADDLLERAAETGNETLCRLAKERGARKFYVMLGRAAHCGHERLCYLAKEWREANGGCFSVDDLDYMLISPIPTMDRCTNCVFSTG